MIITSMHTDFDAMNSATSERVQGEDVRNEAERGNGKVRREMPTKMTIQSRHTRKQIQSKGIFPTNREPRAASGRFFEQPREVGDAHRRICV